MTKERVKSHFFLGIRVDELGISRLNELVTNTVTSNGKIIIACHNLHSLYVFHHNTKMRVFHERADYVHIDGMGIVLIGRLLGYPVKRCHRVTYLDWIRPLLDRASSRSWRVFYLGMRDSICDRVERVLRQDLPDLEFRSAHWDIENKRESILRKIVTEEINDFRPNILFVGLGQPRQEHWILDNYTEISANVILPCGAAMDYIAGAAASPPRWAGNLGIEWLFRLINEPRHLWRRYLIEPWYVLRLFCLQIARTHWQSK